MQPIQDMPGNDLFSHMAESLLFGDPLVPIAFRVNMHLEPSMMDLQPGNIGRMKSELQQIGCIVNAKMDMGETISGKIVAVAMSGPQKSSVTKGSHAAAIASC